MSRKKSEIEMSIPGNVQKCQGDKGDKSVIPQCRRDNFLNSGPSSLEQGKIAPHLEPNFQKMSGLVLYLC